METPAGHSIAPSDNESTAQSGLIGEKLCAAATKGIDEGADLSGASLAIIQFDPGGTPNPNGTLASLQVTGIVQGDDTFAVPGASGCGPNGDGSLNNLVNAVVGLPSPSGANHLVLDNASSLLALPASGLSGGTPITGQEFAADWHLAFGM